MDDVEEEWVMKAMVQKEIIRLGKRRYEKMAEGGRMWIKEGLGKSRLRRRSNRARGYPKSLKRNGRLLRRRGMRKIMQRWRRVMGFRRV